MVITLHICTHALHLRIVVKYVSMVKEQRDIYKYGWLYIVIRNVLVFLVVMK
jgi:hypothetical protein